MITGINTAIAWVLDQDAAKKFFTETLDLEVRADVEMGPGARWLAVGVPGRPDVQVALLVPGPPALDPESGERLKALLAEGALVSKGILTACTFTVDDCAAVHADLAARGVTFFREPEPFPWGVSASFTDGTGSCYELLEPSRTW
ncbi:VOC family protein [Nocardia sp. NPDC052566]|uniref:VOC family protein n=1 Tax=Nocardia sp. NPDC052566 TaxID=3364330 RepID=UPI0037C778FC